VAALEHTWNAIRARHGDLPAVVMVLASGSDGAPAGWLKLGHFAAMRWETNSEHTVMPEVFVGGEGLARGPVEVLGTLLHEATHALAHARGIKDTSRQGRYHNQRFADLARELGLTVTQIQPIGWSNTTVTESTVEEYAAEIASLGEALTIFRRSEIAIFGGAGAPGDDDPGIGTGAGSGDTIGGPRRPRGPRGGPTSNNNGHACRCACGRRIRVAHSVLSAGPITCALCGSDFQPA
jgi:hypothetical protein